jgi:hypothetical protein
MPDQLVPLPGVKICLIYPSGPAEVLSRYSSFSICTALSSFIKNVCDNILCRITEKYPVISNIHRECIICSSLLPGGDNCRAGTNSTCCKHVRTPSQDKSVSTHLTSAGRGKRPAMPGCTREETLAIWARFSPAYTQRQFCIIHDGDAGRSACTTDTENQVDVNWAGQRSLTSLWHAATGCRRASPGPLNRWQKPVTLKGCQGRQRAIAGIRSRHLRNVPPG